MASNEQLLRNFDDEPNCGVDAASDQGYWLEDAGKEANYLISWRKKAGMSPELLSQLAPIPLEEYMSIEKGERTMTNGDAWRIDNAIIGYTVSKRSWLQRSWNGGWLSRCRYKLRVFWESEIGGILIPFVVATILYYGFLREYLAYSEDIFADFLRSVSRVGIPACIIVWLVLWLVREWKKMD